MPYSYIHFKQDVLFHFLANTPSSTKILDVGPGSGTYGRLLRRHYNTIDAIEIWEPYINEFNLRALYNNVYVGSITSFDFTDYDYIILGDVLEHIDAYTSQCLIRSICDQRKKCMIAVPYLYEQGSYHGNPYEEHLQADLTKEKVITRYPQLRFLFGDSQYGHFINYSPKTPPLSRRLELKLRHFSRHFKSFARRILKKGNT
jgi:hypothetical protein